MRTLNSDVTKAVEELRAMDDTVDNTVIFYRWKNAVSPKVGLFSTAHDGDVISHFLDAIDGKLKWPETVVVDGVAIVLEYDVNFNKFVKWVIGALKG